MKETVERNPSNSRSRKTSSKKSNTDTMSPNEKISEALNLVKEAKDDKLQSTRETLNETYNSGMDRAIELRDEAKGRFEQTKEDAAKRYQESKATVEERVKEKPFSYLLGAGFIGLLVGFIFGMRRK